MIDPPKSLEQLEISGQRFEFDGVQFVCSLGRPSNSSAFTICKSQAQLDWYREVLGALDSPTIVELGIAFGGSVVMLSLLTHPKKLVAFELSERPVPELQAFIEERGLETVVRPHYGVDQGDRARLTELLDAELGNELIDVVIDDASHLYDLTVASFEVLFPRLAPGGLYLIEDWTTDHWIATAIAIAASSPDHPGHDAILEQIAHAEQARTDGIARPTPLSRIGVELMLALAIPQDIVTEVSVNPNSIAVRRGPAPIDPTTFRITDLYDDPFDFLASTSTSAP